MNCPVCNKQMTEKDFGGAIVDICNDGCKGIWFDWLELVKLDEENEGCGEALKEALNYPRVNDENRDRLKCPKCNMLMSVHKYKKSKETNVDECFKCGAFFLDSGELKLIRDTYMTEEESEQYLHKLLSDAPLYNEKMDELEKKEIRAKAIRNLTKHIRLSYYLTGK